MSLNETPAVVAAELASAEVDAGESAAGESAEAHPARPSPAATALAAPSPRKPRRDNEVLVISVSLPVKTLCLKLPKPRRFCKL